MLFLRLSNSNSIEKQHNHTGYSFFFSLFNLIRAPKIRFILFFAISRFFDSVFLYAMDAYLYPIAIDHGQDSQYIATHALMQSGISNLFELIFTIIGLMKLFQPFLAIAGVYFGIKSVRKIMEIFSLKGQGVLDDQGVLENFKEVQLTFFPLSRACIISATRSFIFQLASSERCNNIVNHSRTVDLFQSFGAGLGPSVIFFTFVLSAGVITSSCNFLLFCVICSGFFYILTMAITSFAEIFQRNMIYKLFLGLVFIGLVIFITPNFINLLLVYVITEENSWLCSLDIIVYGVLVGICLFGAMIKKAIQPSSEFLGDIGCLFVTVLVLEVYTQWLYVVQDGMQDPLYFQLSDLNEKLGQSGLNHNFANPALFVSTFSELYYTSFAHVVVYFIRTRLCKPSLGGRLLLAALLVAASFMLTSLCLKVFANKEGKLNYILMFTLHMVRETSNAFIAIEAINILVQTFTYIKINLEVYVFVLQILSKSFGEYLGHSYRMTFIGPIETNTLEQNITSLFLYSIGILIIGIFIFFFAKRFSNFWFPKKTQRMESKFVEFLIL